jgi:hypothetical protein
MKWPSGAGHDDDGETLFEEEIAQVQTPVVRLFREYASNGPVVLATTVLSPLIRLVPPYMLKVVIDSAL